MRNVDAKAAASLLKGQDNILILTHMSPDGDTLGSGYALLRGLQQLGKKAQVLCGDVIPQKYAYLKENTREDAFEPQFVVAVDVADEKLLGDDLRGRFGGKIDLCLDHHLSNTQYAENVYMEVCAAACEVIYAVLKELGVCFDKGIADCLYTGLSTDTGCFRYSNVTARTHRIAAELLELGAEADEINRVMFETKTKEYVKLQAEVLSSIEMYLDGKCAFVLLTQQMLKDSGCNETDCDGVSSIPRKIEGVLAGVTVREKADGTFRVSLRTYAPVDASKICKQMGGGGHERAAGCTLDGTKYEAEKEKLLKLIEAEINGI